MAKLLLLVSVVYFVRLAYGQLPTVEPPDDQFIAFDSTDNVTYTCTVPERRSVVWEFRGSQIRSPNQFESLADLGVIIEPANTSVQSSSISIAQLARNKYNDISVQCFSDEVGGINSVGGDIYGVVTVFPPNAPDNLTLVPSDPTLMLEWDRPASNSSIQAQLNYTVDINSTNPNIGMNFRNMTSETFLSVHFLEVLLSPAQGRCVMFEFSVRGENLAGVGETASIIDTVPISPDVTNISRDLTAEVVDLQPLQVRVSFPPVTSCSVNFPLRNYTVSIDSAEAAVHTFTPEDVPTTDGLVTVILPGSSLTGVVQDSSYSLTVTAANDVTRRTSSPTTLYTTDVQRAEAIFFENRLFLRCSFAGSSQARGCAIILTLTGSTETERFDLSATSEGTTSMCTEANNQREAYSSVEALDVEANGNDGVVRLNINSTVTVLTSEDEYIAMTGCRQPTDNTAAIVGGVIGGILFLLIVTTIIVALSVSGIFGRWCACIKQEDMDGIKNGLAAAGQPLLAIGGGAGAISAVDEGLGSSQTDSGGRRPLMSRKTKPLHKKLKDNKYFVLKAEHLMEIMGYKPKPSQPLLNESGEANEGED